MKNNHINTLHRTIAYILLISQLLISCGGKQEMIIPNRFLNDHQENWVEKEECKSTISAIEATEASSVTNQVHEEVTLRSSPTFVPVSQPMFQERVDARLKNKNTFSTNKRMTSRHFRIPVWQKVALFGIALNKIFACASRPYTFNKEPNQHQISSEPEELASTAPTDPVQPKTVEDDLQIPISKEKNKRRPVFARAKNAKKHSKKEENSFYDPLMNSSILENTYWMIEEHIRNERYARKQVQDRAIYLATVAYEKKMLADNLSDKRNHSVIKTFSPPVWEIIISAFVSISCQLEENLMQLYFLHFQEKKKEGDTNAHEIFVLQCAASNKGDKPVDIELAMAHAVKGASLYYMDMSTNSKVYSVDLGEGIDFSIRTQKQDFNVTEEIQYYPIRDLQDRGAIKVKSKYTIPPNTENFLLLQLQDTPDLACLSSFKKEYVHEMLTGKYADCFSGSMKPFFEPRKECYPKSQSDLSTNGDYVFNAIMLYKTAEDLNFHTSNTAYQWSANLKCWSHQGDKKGQLAKASVDKMSVVPYTGGLDYLKKISAIRTMELVNTCYIPPLKEGTGYDLDEHSNCVEIVDAEDNRVHDELIQTNATIELIPT